MASVEANQMLAVAAAACDDKKGEDIRILALDPAESGLSDYFLICTGTNDRQTVAITDEIEIRLKREFGTYPNAVEGRRQGEWILMDYVDFIVHVFLPEKRAFYGLERLRPSATTLSVADLNSEIKAAIRSERSGKKKQVAAAEEAGKAGDPSANEDEAKEIESASPQRKVSAKKQEPAQRSSTKKAATKKTAAKKVASPRELAKGLPAKAAAKKAPSKSARKTATKRTRSAE